MAWELLPVDYTDAVWSGLKKYNTVNNLDGTVSFEDVTEYSNKENSFFGAKEANRMNEALNTLMGMVENGDNLYTVFQEYFATQKVLFEEELEEILADGQARVSFAYVQSTLSASGWSGNTYSFETDYPIDTYNIEIYPNNTCTDAQIAAWEEAVLTGSATSNVITALGTVPTVDIPIIIKIHTMIETAEGGSE